MERSDSVDGIVIESVQQTIEDVDHSSDGSHDPLMNPRISTSSQPIEEPKFEERKKKENETDVNSKKKGSRIFGGLVGFEQVRNGLLNRDQCVPRRILQERIIAMHGPSNFFRSYVAS